MPKRTHSQRYDENRRDCSRDRRSDRRRSSKYRPSKPRHNRRLEGQNVVLNGEFYDRHKVERKVRRAGGIIRSLNSARSRGVLVNGGKNYNEEKERTFSRRKWAVIEEGELSDYIEGKNAVSPSIRDSRHRRDRSYTGGQQKICDHLGWQLRSQSPTRTRTRSSTRDPSHPRSAVQIAQDHLNKRNGNGRTKKRKYAAVFPVFSTDLETKRQARLMEKQLEGRGYECYIVPRRKNPHVNRNVVTITEPESVTKEDMWDFTQWFDEHADEINGLYIMIIAHGHVAKEDDDGFHRPKITMHGGSTYDVSLFIEHFEDKKFPVIVCINSCRTGDIDSVPLFKEFRPQIFLSWAATLGNAANGYKFVEEWRRHIGDVEWEELGIAQIASKIKNVAGGNYYDYLKSDYPCRGGIFDKKEFAPSAIYSSGSHNGDHSAIKLGIQFMGQIGITKKLSFDDQRRIQDISRWSTHGCLQGRRKVLHFPGRLDFSFIAIFFFCTKHINHGLMFQRGEGTTQSDVNDVKKCISRRKLKDPSCKKVFNSWQGFLDETTDQITENKKPRYTKRWSSGVFKYSNNR